MALKPLSYQRTPVAGDTSANLKPKATRVHAKHGTGILDVGMFLKVARRQRTTGKSKAWPAVEQWRRVVGKVGKSLQNVRWKGHGYYLQRSRANEDRSGFDAVQDSGVHIPGRLDDWQQSGDSHMLKIVLSPEHTEDLNLKEYTREFIRNLEADHRTKFDWVAAIHTNTDHAHVHVAIRGVAHNGRKLDLSRDYIRDRVSHYACSVATQMAGMDTRSHERDRGREQTREMARAK